MFVSINKEIRQVQCFLWDTTDFLKFWKTKRKRRKDVWVQTRGVQWLHKTTNAKTLRFGKICCGGGVGCVATKSNLFINSVLKDHNLTYFDNFKLNICTLLLTKWSAWQTECVIPEACRISRERSTAVFIAHISPLTHSARWTVSVLTNATSPLRHNPIPLIDWPSSFHSTLLEFLTL